ncbi:hypothetical protein CHU93_13640 [Sandarakinorhabdus cyanobacteriorum]|uniref:YbjN domain-containing protein n=2 Tax=Sandarakinorhabdus cyanobacteriorum TaxID=1981098 RepID=A0A255Y950_9SPHN|nr:hypothetical protein CHU93_13640 [Sandarakinorhabdus cyanobacteriorum]
MREVGYRAELAQDDLIKSGAGGLSFQITVFAGHSIQCWLGIGPTEPDDFSDTDVFAFNKKYRFAKSYVRIGDTGIRSIMLEQDFLFDVTLPDAAVKIREILDIWERSSAYLKTAMRNPALLQDETPKAE